MSLPPPPSRSAVRHFLDSLPLNHALRRPPPHRRLRSLPAAAFSCVIEFLGRGLRDLPPDTFVH